MACSEVEASIRRGARDAAVVAHLATCAGCRALAAATPSAPLPRIAGDIYERRAKLGEGGMGVTWLAWDRRLGRLVALKEPRADGDDAAVRELLARFEDEARLTARLQHPAIVNVHEAGYEQVDASERLFYTMQPIDGRSLEDEIARRPTLAARLALLPQFTAIANAVAYAHDRGIVHRDLKPANILIGNFGEAVLIDWGLAKAVGGLAGAVPSAVEERTWTVAGSGTLLYMAPEQAAGEPAAPAVDVYALGATLFHLIAGAPAYAELDQLQLRIHLLDAKPAPRVADAIAGVPPELAAIVTRAMAAAPSQRFASAKELADELTRFATGQLVQSYRHSLRERAARWLRQHRLAVVLGVALLAIGAAAFASWLFVGARARSIGAEQRASRLAMDVGLRTDLDRAARLGDRFGADAELAALREVAARHPGPGLAAAVERGLVALTLGEQARVVPRRGAPPTLLASGYLGLADPFTVVRLVDGAEVVRLADADARAVAVSGDQLALAVCAGGVVRRFGLPTGAPLPAGPAPVPCPAGARLRLSGHGRILAMATAAGVQLVDLQRGAALEAAAAVRDVVVARDADVLLIERSDGTVQRLGPGVDGRLEFGARWTPVSRPRALSPDGGIAAFGRDRQVWLQPVGAATPPVLLVGDLLELGNTAAVVAGADDGLRLATAPAWRAELLAGPSGTIVELARSPDGQVLATRDAAGAVATWAVDPARPTALVPVQRVAAPADRVALIDAAQLVILDDGGARVVDVPTARRLVAHGPIARVSGDGRVLAALTPRPRGAEPVGPCATIDVVDLATALPLGQVVLPTFCDAGRRMYLDDAGAHVVLATPSGSDAIDVRTGELVRLAGVDVVAVSPGGRWLIGAAGTPVTFGIYDRTAPSAPPVPLPLMLDLASAAVAFDDADRAVAVVAGGQAALVDLAAAPAVTRTRAGVELVALAGGGAAVAGAGGAVTWAPTLDGDAGSVALAIQLTGAVSALAATTVPAPRVAVASARRVSGGASIATIELFDAVTGRSLATAETSHPATRLYFTPAGYLIAQGGGALDVYSVDGAPMLSVAADAIASDLGFVTRTAGPSTSVAPLRWPAATDLLAPGWQRSNARVCATLDRVSFALPFADAGCP